VNSSNPLSIPLDQTTVGQGQILSIVGLVVSDSSQSSGITPLANYGTLELLYGSQVDLRQQAPAENVQEWVGKHGRALPAGVWGWDLAMTRSDQFTNEQALNTLVQAGCQVRLTWSTGNVPAAGAQVLVAIESLKKVGV
jgi:hypothetical protein